MRMVAKRMREKVEEYEENKVEVRREDKTIRPFTIPRQKELPMDILKLSSYKVVIDHKTKDIKCNVLRTAVLCRQ